MKIFVLLLSFCLVIPTWAEEDGEPDADGVPADCTDPTAARCIPDSAYKMSVDDANSKLQKDLDQCRTYRSSAEDCCSNPNACEDTTAPDGSTLSGDMQTLMKTMMTVSAATMLAQSSPDQMSSMTQLCNMFGGMNTAGAAVNGGTAQACNASKKTCTDYCAGANRYWVNIAKSEKSSKELQDYVNKNRPPLDSGNQACNALSPSVIKAQAKNQGNAGTGSMQNVCSALAQQQQQQQAQQLQPVSPPNVPDCTNPLIANTSVCVVCNSQGTASSACQQAITDSAGAATAFQASQTLNANNSSNFNAGDPGRIAQNAQFPENQNQNPRAANNSTPYGTGSAGMLPTNPSAPLAGPGGGRGGGQPGSPSYNLGERSGGGYSGPGGSLAADTTNGFSGYGNPHGPALDLKNYLPGRKFYAGRKVAGVGSPNPDINPQGVDIFKRISDRFQIICSSNRLLDCTPNKVPNNSGL